MQKPTSQGVIKRIATAGGWAALICAGTVCFLGACLVISREWPKSSSFIESSGPAWIQAFGSVAAIIGASLIATRQMRHAQHVQEEQRTYAEMQKFQVIKALMARAHGLSNDVIKAFETSKHEDFDQISPTLMADTHQTIMSLPVFEIPNGLLSLDVLTIGRGIDVLRQQWEALIDTIRQTGSVEEAKVAPLLTLADELREISLAAINTCNDELKQRKCVLDRLFT